MLHHWQDSNETTTEEVPGFYLEQRNLALLFSEDRKKHSDIIDKDINR